MNWKFLSQVFQQISNMSCLLPILSASCILFPVFSTNFIVSPLELWFLVEKTVSITESPPLALEIGFC